MSDSPSPSPPLANVRFHSLGPMGHYRDCCHHSLLLRLFCLSDFLINFTVWMPYCITLWLSRRSTLFMKVTFDCMIISNASENVFILISNIWEWCLNVHSCMSPARCNNLFYPQIQGLNDQEVRGILYIRFVSTFHLTTFILISIKN